MSMNQACGRIDPEIPINRRNFLVRRPELGAAARNLDYNVKGRSLQSVKLEINVGFSKFVNC